MIVAVYVLGGAVAAIIGTVVYLAVSIWLSERKSDGAVTNTEGEQG